MQIGIGLDDIAGSARGRLGWGDEGGGGRSDLRAKVNDQESAGREGAHRSVVAHNSFWRNEARELEAGDEKMRTVRED